MKRALMVVLGLGLGANGLFMLFAPARWYSSVPGVVDTGPYNEHFVRDIGCAFFVSAIGLLWLSATRRGWPAALAGGLFLSLHAVVHVWDTIAGREHAHRLVSEIPTVVLPGAIVLWLALSGESAPAPKAPRTAHGFFGRMVKRSLAGFERRYGYDSTYLVDVADASAPAIVKFGLFNAFSGHREGVPRDAFFTARITATLSEDCGPCTQLMVDMAAEEGMDAAVLRAIVVGNEAAMNEDARRAYRFAKAVLSRDLAAADEARGDVVKAWGAKGMVTLAFSVASARVFPTLKYGLGHARTCSRVRIAGADTVPAR